MLIFQNKISTKDILNIQKFNGRVAYIRSLSDIFVKQFQFYDQARNKRQLFTIYALNSDIFKS